MKLYKINSYDFINLDLIEHISTTEQVNCMCEIQMLNGRIHFVNNDCANAIIEKLQEV